MSLDTVCRSMYSDISKRVSSSPSCSANCFVTSVLPTPVGPASKKEPMGLSPDRSPALRQFDRSYELGHRFTLSEHDHLKVRFEFL